MLSANPREPSLALSFVPPEQIEVATGKRSRPYLAVVVGRSELVIIRRDGNAWHDGELIVTPILVALNALPPASDVLPPEYRTASAPP